MNPVANRLKTNQREGAREMKITVEGEAKEIADLTVALQGQPIFKSKKDKGIGILNDDYTKLVVLNTKTDEEIAVITCDDAETSSDDIVIKMTPKYD